MDQWRVCLSSGAGLETGPSIIGIRNMDELDRDLARLQKVLFWLLIGLVVSDSIAIIGATVLLLKLIP